MKRKQLLPEFYESSFEGWAVKYVHKNFWKFGHSLGSMEDAMAEAAVVFYECRRMYGWRVESPAHFMALFKRVMVTWFIDWAHYETKQRKMMETKVDETTYTYKRRQLVEESEARLRVLLRECSRELRQVLEFIFRGKGRVEGNMELFEYAVKQCGSEHLTQQLEQELRALLA